MIASPNPAFPQINSALQRSATLRYWERIQDAGYSAEHKAHLYLVPSQTRQEVEHVVAVTPKALAPAAPIWARFACTCEARARAACLHRAAVFQSLYLARYGAIPRALARPKPAGPAAAPAPAQPASPPPGEAAQATSYGPGRAGLGASTPFSRPPLASPVSEEPLWEPARPGTRPSVRRVALT